MEMPTSSARNLVHATIATVSGLFIALAVVFGAVALAVAGLMIGLAGAMSSHLRAKPKSAQITLTAKRRGHGWIIDPSDR